MAEAAGKKGAAPRKAPADAGKGGPAAPAKRPADTALRLYEALRDRVVAYKIPPGARVNEVEVARELRSSRTPVREALNRLATEGLLVFEPNRGFSARPLDTKEVFDLYEARKVVEAAGARLACARAPDDAIAALAAFWAGVAAEGEARPVTDLVRLDEEFHERLIALSGNAELARALRGLDARIHFVRWVDLDREERRRGTYLEHGLVLDALAARDEARCAELLAAHIDRRMDQIVEVIREGVVRLFVR